MPSHSQPYPILIVADKNNWPVEVVICWRCWLEGLFTICALPERHMN